MGRAPPGPRLSAAAGARTAGGDRAVKIWDVETGLELLTLSDKKFDLSALLGGVF